MSLEIVDLHTARRFNVETLEYENMLAVTTRDFSMGGLKKQVQVAVPANDAESFAAALEELAMRIRFTNSEPHTAPTPAMYMGTVLTEDAV
jgi:hypothetical protein